MLSPLFKVATYGVEEANYYPIRCTWTFLENLNSKENKMEIEDPKVNNPAKQTSILFDKGCAVPNVKSITFHRDECVEIKLLYDPPVDGFDPLLTHVYVQNQKSVEPEHNLKVRLHLNSHNIVEFESA